MLQKIPIEQIESMIDHLPVEISFVDADDTVVFYSHGDKRIFKRSPAVIGKKVQNCHPQKSVHIVQRILDDFRVGKRDVAEFWINLSQRLIYIRYFAVRGKNNEYNGTLEVTQDVTDIKKMEGEKRLID